MTTSIENTKGAADKIVLSIDAMGGDRGPAAVVAGGARAARRLARAVGRSVCHQCRPHL